MPVRIGGILLLTFLITLPAVAQSNKQTYQLVDSLIATSNSYNAHKAIDLLKTELAADSTQSGYWVRYSKAAAIRLRITLAEECIEKAIQLDPKNDEAYFVKAQSHNQYKEYTAAIQEMDKAIQLNGKGEYYFWRGVFYQNSDLFQMAEADYNTAIGKGFENAHLYNNLAICLSEDGKYAEGLQAIEQAIVLNPNYAAAFSARSKLNFFLFRIDQACSDEEKAKQMGHQWVMGIPKEVCEETDSNKQIHLSADLLALEKMYHLAIEGYTRIFKNGYSDGYAFMNRGYCYYQLKEYDLAEKDYLQALERMSAPYDLLLDNISLLYYDMGRYEQSIEYSTRRIELDPMKCEAYLERGGAYRELKKYKLAEKDFNTCLEINPQYFRAYGYRALMYVEMGNYDAAMIDALKAIELNREYGYAHRVLALAKMGKKEPGYCMDLYQAEKLGDQSASELIDQYCK